MEEQRKTDLVAKRALLSLYRSISKDVCFANKEEKREELKNQIKEALRRNQNVRLG